jgi:8-oxo-dGTP pyrophosphatase MutT (NUDIX family)
VVKDHIAQGAEFGACALFLAPLALRAWNEARRRQAVCALLLALCFVSNVVYIGTSRTGLVITAALLGLFAWKFLNRNSRISLLAALVMVSAVSWPLTSNLRDNVASFVHEMRTYDPNAEGSRSGERLEYWQKSIGFVSAAPLIGHGTGSIRDQFRRSAEDKIGVSADIAANPHNQTFAVAIQLGSLGVAVLWAMWIAHLALFRGDGLAAWFGLVVVVQNIVGSLFNSHLFDFTQGWSYVLGVGVAGGVMLGQARRPVSADTSRAASAGRRMTSRHVAVVILYDAEGKMLLQHRTKDAPTFPNYWALFGGGIEAGETPEQAVKRECLEELGYKLKAPRPFMVKPLHHDGASYVIHSFVERYNGSPLTLAEGQGMGWFREDETAGLLMNEHDRAFVRGLAQLLDAER